MKKRMLCLMLVFVLAATGFGVSAFAAPDDAVMLVAPARYSVMQVSFDVARRYPTVLVSYQGAGDETALHVWDGYDWLPISMADYQSGAFLQALPSRTILLGDDALLPGEMKSVSSWCATVVQLPNLQTPQLVNGIGQALPFTPSDWRWFAGRYNLSLTNLRAEEAEQARTESWYKEPGAVKDPAPGFFRYFTRSRRAGGGSDAPMVPVTVAPGDVVDIPAP